MVVYHHVHVVVHVVLLVELLAHRKALRVVSLRAAVLLHHRSDKIPREIQANQEEAQHDREGRIVRGMNVAKPRLQQVLS